MEVFLVCVILKPTKKQQDEEGAQPKIIVQPQAVIAKDSQQAAMKAWKFIPDEDSGKEDRLEVRVLPFRAVERV